MRSALAAIAWAATLASALPARAEPPTAGKPIFTGHASEFIDYVGAGGLLHPFSEGLSGSPTNKSSEIDDAFAEFADKDAALQRLEEIKRARGYSGGTTFVSFRVGGDISDTRMLSFSCGVSRTEISGKHATSASEDKDIRKHATEEAKPEEDGYVWFSRFKKATYAERVRAIARCFAKLPGMPKLKPSAHAELKQIYIDDASYGAATGWLSESDPPAVRGTSAQYRRVFLCLVSQAAREMPEAMGDSAVFSTLDEAFEVETGPRPRGFQLGYTAPVSTETYHQKVYRFSVLNDASARELRKETDDDDSQRGLWPSNSGIPHYTLNGVENPFEQALGAGSVRAHMPECRRRAGLFDLPPAKVPDPAPAAACPQ